MGQPEGAAAQMQHVEGCPDPLLCSCIGYAGLMGQILALEARRDAECLPPSCFAVQPHFDDLS